MTVTRNAIVTEARSWIGTPYRHQASLKGAGCDCLGLIRGVWRVLYGDEPETPPPYAVTWSGTGGSEPLAEAARRHFAECDPADIAPGDILLFRWRGHLPARHAAIAANPTTMIHAHDGCAVCEVSLSPWWRRHMAYAFRFPGVED